MIIDIFYWVFDHYLTKTAIYTSETWHKKIRLCRCQSESQCHLEAQTDQIAAVAPAGVREVHYQASPRCLSEDSVGKGF